MRRVRKVYKILFCKSKEKSFLAKCYKCYMN